MGRGTAAWVLSASALVVLAVGACECRKAEHAAQAGPARVLRLATTTSTEDSGLLTVLLPPFAEKHGIKVEVVAVGSGKAITLGRNGDVDVILVHDPEAEKKFVGDGAGVNRRNVMHNDFVVVGPASDPAGIKGMTDAAGAFERIGNSRSAFVSRGDESGTHVKEKSLWREADVEQGGGWYLAAGQGMGAVLNIASEKQAYAITDRGTWVALRGKLDLTLLLEGDPRLANPYGVIAVNQARHPEARYMDAMLFIAWLTSVEGQELIAGFKVDGETLFSPDAAAKD